LQDKELKTFAYNEGEEPRFFLIYMSAKWEASTPPQMPKLAKYYTDTVRPIPGLDLIYYSYDTTERDQLELMKSGPCAFPAVDFKHSGEDGPLGLILKNAGAAVPQFLLLDAQGKKLYDKATWPSEAELKELTKSSDAP
jgi:hypothetical protein